MVVVAAPDGHFLVPKKDNDIAFRNTVVASYANLSRVRCDHDFNLAERRLFVATTMGQSPANRKQLRSCATNAAGSPLGGLLGLI